MRERRAMGGSKDSPEDTRPSSSENRQRKKHAHPSTAFRRKMKKFSARIIKNRIIFLHKIISISSACLILIDTLTEFTDPSINTFSFLFREMITGASSNSVLPIVSISGLLCRSTSCDEKFSRHIAACSVDLTAARYVARVFDCKEETQKKRRKRGRGEGRTGG